MLLAIAGTLLHHGIVDHKWVIDGSVLGTASDIPLGRVQSRRPSADRTKPRFWACCASR